MKAMNRRSADQRTNISSELERARWVLPTLVAATALACGQTLVRDEATPADANSPSAMTPVESLRDDTPRAEAPTAAEIVAAGELFASSCAACHLPPDPSFFVDRAWLEQVRDTA